MPRIYVKKEFCKNGHPLNSENRENGTGQCKICKKANVQKFLSNNPEYRKQWRQKHKSRLRLEHISRYGIDENKYNELLTKQQGKCKICGVLFGKDLTPHVDHDHTTEKVRGLLCRACNSGLGQFSDSVLKLEAAIVYLKEG